MPLDQRCNVAVFSSGQQIAFPVPGIARSSASAGRSRIEMASTICPRECPCSLKLRERRMRRFDRKWSISSFFNTPRA